MTNMGYSCYVLPDGREAGYGVEAQCDRDNCDTTINRGTGFLCGDWPDGHRAEVMAGCGKYFCLQHQGLKTDYDLHAGHDCPKPECGAYSAENGENCVLAWHEIAIHMDEQGQTFTLTEDDD